MNIFEREAEERDDSLQWKGILSAWGSFKTVVFQLIDSYKTLIPEGQLYGAEIEEPDERSIVIVCPRGASPHGNFSSLVITIRAKMATQEKFAISCHIEQWRKARVASASAYTEWEKPMTFVLDGDHTSLIFANEKFTPTQAANKLLETSLIRK
jgi:hypothetical protein